MTMKILKAIGLVTVCCVAPIPVLAYLGICAIIDIRRCMGRYIDTQYRCDAMDDDDIIDAEDIE